MNEEAQRNAKEEYKKNPTERLYSPRERAEIWGSGAWGTNPKPVSVKLHERALKENNHTDIGANYRSDGIAFKR